MENKYSVIVPIYKVEQFIVKCIESIINQTYNNLEIILVNDGSPDHCPRICEDYKNKDDRIIVLHKENGGLVSARKAGASIATGDYICCVDGDDYISTDYIEKINAVLINNEIDIVCCGYYSTEANKKTPICVNSRAGLYTKKDIEKEIFPFLIMNNKGKYFLPTVWGKAIKKELYIKNQMIVDDGISMGEDGACTIPCIYGANSIYILPDFLYYYRFNRTSMTKDKKPLNWDNQQKIYIHISKMVDLSLFDFRQQLYRRLVKGFFSVAKSKFYDKSRSYRDIKKDILEHIGEKTFNAAINNASFENSIYTYIIDKPLKRRWIIMLFLISKIS